ncbi:MobA/MobL family protein [Xenorhabdus sp. XENO-10]|uniref:MobA/MobL family protein n=1 Tax=Xenorhabdus yunnanensis TaxID=3025878 RepID=A0ABT5LEX5_9GAMM|nr:MobA/MobL family protein [Xenorhabdus yunnanensis]
MSADGGDQPHCHLMFSVRINDAIRSDSEQYFRRYNPKKPKHGGCQETYSGLTIETRKARLMQLRENWQNTCNQHLERAQRPERIAEEIQNTTKALIVAGCQTRDEELRQLRERTQRLNDAATQYLHVLESGGGWHTVFPEKIYLYPGLGKHEKL